MRATQTFVVDLERLQRQGPHANLVVRLMRAADDIALANWGLNHYTNADEPRLRRHVQQGARRYFVRLQCGHMAEGLKLIEEVQNSRRLKTVLTVMDSLKLRFNVWSNASREEFDTNPPTSRSRAPRMNQ